MIEFFQFQKKYGQNVCLAIPHLTINPGVHWIKGVNGSGKTTLFKSMAGLIPYEGSIVLDGETVMASKPVLSRKLVSMAEAEPIFPGFLKGIELIQFYGESRNATKNQIESVTGALKIHEFYDRKLSDYSSGMKKKLSIALAFVGDVKYILLDEPLNALDTSAIPVVLQLIKDASLKGITICISTHQDIAPDDLHFDSIFEVVNRTVTKV